MSCFFQKLSRETCPFRSRKGFPRGHCNSEGTARSTSTSAGRNRLRRIRTFRRCRCTRRPLPTRTHARSPRKCTPGARKPAAPLHSELRMEYHRRRFELDSCAAGVLHSHFIGADRSGVGRRRRALLRASPAARRAADRPLRYSRAWDCKLAMKDSAAPVAQRCAVLV